MLTLFDEIHIRHTQLETLQNFIWAEHNFEIEEKLRLCYPNWDDLHPGYQTEKLEKLRRGGLMQAYSALDKEHKVAFLETLNKHYRFDPIDKCKSFPEEG